MGARSGTSPAASSAAGAAAGAAGRGAAAGAGRRLRSGCRLEAGATGRGGHGGDYRGAGGALHFDGVVLAVHEDVEGPETRAFARGGFFQAVEILLHLGEDLLLFDGGVDRVLELDLLQGLGLDLIGHRLQPVLPLEEAAAGGGIERIDQDVAVVFGQALGGRHRLVPFGLQDLAGPDGDGRLRPARSP